MTGPPLPPIEGTAFGNPELRNYVMRSLQKKLATDFPGVTVTPEYMEDAVQKYMQPGSPLRETFFAEKARRGMVEKEEASLGGGMDVAQRFGRNVGTSALQALTSPGRAVMWAAGKLGLDAATEANQAFGQSMQDMSGAGMGNKGLTGNSLLDAGLEATAQVGGSLGGSAMLANKIAGNTGNFLTNLAARNPGSRVLQALGTVPGQPIAGTGVGSQLANVARATPRAAVQGFAAGVGSMPSEAFEPESLGLSLLLSGLGAGAASRFHTPVAGSARAAMVAPGPSRLSAARGMFAPPEMGAPEPGVSAGLTPEGASIPDIAPVVDAPPSVELPLPKAASPRGDPAVTTGTLAPQWEAVAAPLRARAAAGDQAAASQLKAIFEQFGGSAPAAPAVAPAGATVSPRKATVPRKAPARDASFGGAKIELTPEESAAVTSAWDRLTTNERVAQTLRQEQIDSDPDLVVRARENSFKDLPGFMQKAFHRSWKATPGRVDAAGNTAPPDASAVAQSALAKAGLVTPSASQPAVTASPRAAKLTPAVVPPAAAAAPEPTPAPALSLQEQIAAAQAENARLKGPAAAAAPVAAPTGAKASARGVPRVAARPVEPEAKGTAQIADASSVIINPDKKVSPGWWDSEHALPKDKESLLGSIISERQMAVPEGAAAKWAAMPFESLPKPIRSALPLKDQPGVVPEGGAPAAGAGFPKRRPAAKRVAKPAPEPKGKPTGKRA